MIGLSILLALVAYVWLARFVAKRIKNRTAKYTVIAIFILIPTWDVIPGKLYFKQLCEKEGGLKIYKTVEDVEGYRVYPGATGLGPEAVEKYGYKFEERGSGRNFTRYTLGPDGKVIRQEVNESIARYVAEGKGWTPLSWNVNKYEVFIFEQQTKEGLAAWTTFSSSQSWLVAFIDFPKEITYCPKPPASEKDLYLRTLKPVKSNS